MWFDSVVQLKNVKTTLNYFLFPEVFFLDLSTENDTDGEKYI